uniref:Desmoplakin n=1 Tax=Pieris brassicae granulosis virus TaxID=10465 RepID=A0A7G9U8S4_GVPB|nr:desmoplakin [Pieris brassicae granulovirus]
MFFSASVFKRNWFNSSSLFAQLSRLLFKLSISVCKLVIFVCKLTILSFFQHCYFLTFGLPFEYRKYIFL